jgi:acetyl esterase/lipase
MIAKLILSLALLSGYASAIDRGEEIRLWPNGAPGSEGETAPEVFDSSANSKLPKRFTVVHYPSIYVFLPPKEKANGMAVVVAPGGGHSQLVIDKEGWEIADWLNGNGIAAFVLKYRLARAPGSHYTVDRDALADAARAMRTVRSRSAEWGVDPARIGFMGFSAGGELAALIETRFDSGNPGAAADPVERAASRPDFVAAIYPGFKPGTNHRAERCASGISHVYGRRPRARGDHGQPVSGSGKTGRTYRDAYLCQRTPRRGNAALASASGHLARPAARLDGRPEAA